MSSPGSRLDQVLRDPRVWRAGRVTARARATVSSGWPELDEALNGGWPLGQLTELLIDAHGVGEFALLLPALRGLMMSQRRGTQDDWVALASFPHIPYAPALARAGIDLSRLLLIRSGRDSDTLWAMEQALHARACAAVVGWSDSRDVVSLRRLQLAAEAGNAWTVLFRSARLQSLRSPAPLRIRLLRESGRDRLELRVLKRRDGPAVVVGVDTGR